MRILVVCTANRCRSPLAAATLRRHVAERGLRATVTSAGLLEAGQPVPAAVIEELGHRGLEPDGTSSRQLTADLVRSADLVLTMERAHAREVALLVPEALARTFTLKELVRRGEAAAHRGEDEPVDVWLATLDATRRPESLLGRSRDDDVADPFGGSRRTFRRVAIELDELTDRAARLLA